MITFKHRGNFSNTEKFLTAKNKAKIRAILEKYGQIGVNALSEATPVDSGLTRMSWYYSIDTNKGYKISWYNSNIVDGVPVVILIQYGHGTADGGFIQGNDFINPTMKPIFDKLSNDLWREVAVT